MRVQAIFLGKGNSRSQIQAEVLRRLSSAGYHIFSGVITCYNLLTIRGMSHQVAQAAQVVLPSCGAACQHV